MKALTNRLFLFSALIIAGHVFGADTPLQTHMKTLAGNFKTVQNSLKAIAASPSANHDADWANAEGAAGVMAQTADEAAGLFPANVAGNPQAEAAFTAAVNDLAAAIKNELIYSLQQRDLASAQNAVQVILQKKADGHNAFIPQDGEN